MSSLMITFVRFVSKSRAAKSTAEDSLRIMRENMSVVFNSRGECTRTMFTKNPIWYSNNIFLIFKALLY